MQSRSSAAYVKGLVGDSQFTSAMVWPFLLLETHSGIRSSDRRFPTHSDSSDAMEQSRCR